MISQVLDSTDIIDSGFCFLSLLSLSLFQNVHHGVSAPRFRDPISLAVAANLPKVLYNSISATMQSDCTFSGSGGLRLPVEGVRGCEKRPPKQGLGFFTCLRCVTGTEKARLRSWRLER